MIKASVQYNDFLGTSAADISDHTDLSEFLTRRGVSTEIYKPIGAGFYGGYEDFFIGYILCKDLQKSTATKPHIVRLDFEKEIEKDEFFSLFKRFEVIITTKHGGYEQHKIDEEINIPVNLTNEDDDLPFS